MSQHGYLLENKSDLDENKVLKLSDNISKGYTQGIVIEYYPNSRVIKNSQFIWMPCIMDK